MPINYLVQKETKMTLPGKVIKAKISGTDLRILLTPLDGIADFLRVSVYDNYTLVTLLDYPWTSYPFKLPLADYVGDGYLLEKLYYSDRKYLEQAQKLCHLLKNY
jgi:hypothetical protein